MVTIEEYKKEYNRGNNLQKCANDIIMHLGSEVLSMLGKPAKVDGQTIFDHSMTICRHLDMEYMPYSAHSIVEYCNHFGLSLDVVMHELSFVVLMHDLGKSNDLWQKYINDCMHGVFAKTSHVRHELCKMTEILKSLADCKYSDKTFANEQVIIAILAHHGKLSRYFWQNYEFVTSPQDAISEKYYILDKIHTKNGDFDIRELYLFNDHNSPINKDCAMTGAKIQTTGTRTNDVLNNIGGSHVDLFYRISLYRHILQIGDREASAIDKFYNKNINGYYEYEDYPLKHRNQFTLTEKFSTIKKRPLQERIMESDPNSLVTSIRARCGGGKTIAALYWIKRCIDHKFADRAIIAMPTMFTCDSVKNCDVDDYVLLPSVYHSGHKTEYVGRNIDFRNIRGFDGKMSVVTIDQVINSLTLCDEIAKSATMNLINSCIVIDELDFYDDFVIANLIKLIKFCKIFNIHVLLMSATMSNRHIEVIRRDTGVDIEALEVMDEDDKTFQKYNVKSVDRIECSMVNKHITSLLIGRDNAIVYCNTVHQAISLYTHITNNKEIVDHVGMDNIIVHTSSNCQLYKRRTEERIYRVLGTDAWANGNTPRGIVIMTQIGELSLNISADFMVSFVCPVDRLTQRLGRGCRFDRHRILDAHIIIATDKRGKLYPYPYGGKPFKRSVDLLEKNGKHSYTYKELIDLTNVVYADFEIGEDAQKNADALPEIFKNNIIMNSSLYDSACDDMAVMTWKCRDIEDKVMIFADVDDADEGYNIDTEKLFYDGMSTSEFITNCAEYSIKCISKTFEKLRPYFIERKIRVDNIEHTLYIIDKGWVSDVMDCGIDFRELGETFENEDTFL